ncbi:hypothetical protein [Tropicibacter naphthalenivorans]|uniref:hypothetical protein n=1 Tax=Tropicibacter naphthalenivorans TaxID=441103 RepID=UPI00117CD432|nr:hypothetical protein [Tropicibacter naphthalenivorans]
MFPSHFKKFSLLTTTLLILGVSAPFALAKDGKAWGGRCTIFSQDGSHVISRSCDADGVSCSGNGWGGVDCSINGKEGTYSEGTAARKIDPALKQKLSSKPAVSN